MPGAGERVGLASLVGVGVAVGLELGVTTGVTATIGDGVIVPLEQPVTAMTTAASPSTIGQNARCLTIGSFQASATQSYGRGSIPEVQPSEWRR
jgi:hypothetical protein